MTTGGDDAAGPDLPDLSGLVEQMGDEALAADIVEVYLDALPERVEALEAARGGVREDTVRVAHSLKSASALVGLSALSARSAALEAAAKTPDDTVPGLLEEVLALTGPAEAGLREWLAAHGRSH